MKNKVLFITTIILSIFGLIMIYSSSYVWASYKFNNAFKYAINQGIFLILGIVLMLVVSKIDHQIYKKYSNQILAITLILLILVLIPGIGVVRNGSRSWFGIGSFGFQPSEVCKLSLVIFVSKYLSRNDKDKRITKNFVFPILLVILLLLIAFFVSLNTIKKGDTAKTRVVINNRNIILKNEAYIDGKIVYLSKQDIKNFFDKYIYEEGTKQIITTYGKKIAEINYNSNIVTINDSQKQIAAPIKKIEENTYIADTPGFSSFEINEIESSELDKYFIEIEKELGNCEFVGCTHIKEKNCGVKQAVQDGKISQGRYERFCEIYNELKDKEKYKWK